MAIAKFQLPDGRVARIEVPDGMDPQTAQAQLQSMYEQGGFESQASAPDDLGGNAGNDSGGSDRSAQSGFLGGLEAAGTVASSIVAEPLAGLAGIGALLPGGRTPSEAVEQTRESLRYEPRTQAGQEALQATGEFLAPVGEFFEGAEDYLGNAVFEKTGSPTLAAAAETLPTLIAELVGVGGARGLQTVAKNRKALNTAKTADKMIEQAAPSADQLKQVSRGLYREVDEMGAVVDPNKFRVMAYEIQEAANKAGMRAKTTPAAKATVDEIFELAESRKPVTLDELFEMREVAQGVAGKLTDTKEAALGSIIVDRIDDFAGSSGVLSPDFKKSVGANVGARLKVARELWGRARRSELMEQANERALNAASGYENGLRNSFRSILNNKKQSRYFNAEEKKAMQEVVRGSDSANAMKLLGKFGFGFGAAGNMLGGTIGPAVAGQAGGKFAALAASAAGTAARKASEAMTGRAARQSDALVRAGRDARKIAKEYVSSVANPDVDELSQIFLRQNAEFPPISELDEFTRRAVQKAARRRAELAAAAGVGATERGASETVVPMAIGAR